MGVMEIAGWLREYGPAPSSPPNPILLLEPIHNRMPAIFILLMAMVYG